MTSTSIVRSLLTLALVAVLGACGDDAPPPAADASAVDETPVAAAPKRAVRAMPTAPPPEAPPPVVQTAFVAPEETGAQAPKTPTDAFTVGHQAFDRFCQQQAWDCTSFATKETVREGDHWKLTLFGVVAGQGRYISVIVNDDGTSQINH